MQHHIEILNKKEYTFLHLQCNSKTIFCSIMLHVWYWSN